MDVDEILKTVGSSAVVVAAVAWVGRSIVSQFLSMDLEEHKLKLKADADRELARLTADLQIAAARERTRFDLLHQKRAEVIAKVYALIARTHRAARNFARPMEWSGEPTKQEKFDELSAVGNELGTYFGENRIYFPEKTCTEFDEMYHKIRIATQTMMDDLGSGEGGRMRSWADAWKAVDSEVPPMLRELELQFRQILGAPDGHDGDA